MSDSDTPWFYQFSDGPQKKKDEELEAFAADSALSASVGSPQPAASGDVFDFVRSGLQSAGITEPSPVSRMAASVMPSPATMEGLFATKEPPTAGTPGLPNLYDKKYRAETASKPMSFSEEKQRATMDLVDYDALSQDAFPQPPFSADPVLEEVARTVPTGDFAQTPEETERLRSMTVPGVVGKPTASQLAFYRRRLKKKKAELENREKFIRDFERRTNLTVDVDALDEKFPVLGDFIDTPPSLQERTASRVTPGQAFGEESADRLIRKTAIDRASADQIRKAYEAQRRAVESSGFGGMLGFDFLGSPNQRKSNLSLEERTDLARDVLRKQGAELNQSALTELGVAGSEAIRKAEASGRSKVMIADTSGRGSIFDSLGTDPSFIESPLFVEINPGAALLGWAQETSDIVTGQDSSLQKMGSGFQQFGRTVANVFSAPKDQRSGIETLGRYTADVLTDPERLVRDFKLMRLDREQAPERWFIEGVKALPEDTLNLIKAPFLLAYELGGGLLSPDPIDVKLSKSGKFAADMGHMILEAGADPYYSFSKGPITQALNFYIISGGPLLSKMKRRVTERKRALESELQNKTPGALEELAKLEEINKAVDEAQAALDKSIEAQAGLEKSIPFAQEGANLRRQAQQTSAEIKDVVSALNKNKRKAKEATETLRGAEAERGTYVVPDEPGRILGTTEAGFTPAPGRVESFRRAREGERVAGKQATFVSTAVDRLSNSLQRFEKQNNAVLSLQQKIEATRLRAKKAELDKIDQQIAKLEESARYEATQRRSPQLDKVLSDPATLRRIEAKRNQLVELRAQVEAAPIADSTGRFASLVSELDNAVAERTKLRTDLVLNQRALRSMVEGGGAQFMVGGRVGPRTTNSIAELAEALAKTDEIVFNGEFGQRAKFIDERISQYQSALRENAVREIKRSEADGALSAEFAEAYIKLTEDTKYALPDGLLRRIAAEADQKFTRPEVGAPDRLAMRKFTAGSIADVQSAVGRSLAEGRAAVGSAKKARTEFQRTKRQIREREFELRKKERLAKLALDEAAGATFELTGRYRAKAKEAKDISAKAPETVYPKDADFAGKPKGPDPISDKVLAGSAMVEVDAIARAMLDPSMFEQVTKVLDAIASKAESNLKPGRVEARPVLIENKYPATQIETLAFERMDLSKVVESNKKDLANKVTEAQRQRDLVNSVLDANRRLEEQIVGLRGDFPKTFDQLKSKVKSAATDPVSELGLAIISEFPRMFFGADVILSPFRLGSQYLKMISASKSNPRLRYFLRNPSERLSEWFQGAVKEAELSRSIGELEINKVLEAMPNEVKPKVAEWMHMQHEAAARMPTGERIFSANPDRALITYMDEPGFRGYVETKLGLEVAGKSLANAAYMGETLTAMNEVSRPITAVSRNITKRAVNQGLFTDPSNLRPLWWKETYDPKVTKRLSEKIDAMFELAAEQFPDLAPQIEPWLKQRKALRDKGSNQQLVESIGSAVDDALKSDEAGLGTSVDTSALNANLLRRAAERWQRAEDARVKSLTDAGKKAEPRDNPFSIERREAIGLITDLDVAAKTGVAEMLETVARFEFLEQVAESKTGSMLSHRQYKQLEKGAKDGTFDPKAADAFIDVREATKRMGSEWLSSEKKVPRYGKLTGIKTVDPKTGKVTWRLREGSEKLYMNADDFYEMEAAHRLQKQLKKALPKIITRWKVFQTAGSPMTFFRNVWSNVFMFAPMADNSPLNPSNWPYYAKALKDSLLPKGKRSGDWQIGYENNAYRTTFSQAEFRQLEGMISPMQGGIRNGVDFVMKLMDLPLVGPTSVKRGVKVAKDPSMQTVGDFVAAATGARYAGQAIGTAGGLLTKLYSWGDDLFRSAFINKQLDVYRKTKRDQMLRDLDQQLKSGQIDWVYFAKQDEGIFKAITDNLKPKPIKESQVKALENQILAGQLTEAAAQKAKWDLIRGTVNATADAFYSTIKNALNKANIKVPKGIAERIAKEAEDKFVNYSDISGVVQVLRAPAAPLPGAAAAFFGYTAYALMGQPFISFVAKANPLWLKFLENNPVKAMMYHNIGAAITEANKIQAAGSQEEKDRIDATMKMLPPSQGGRYITLGSISPALARTFDSSEYTGLGSVRDLTLLDAAWLSSAGYFYPDVDLLGTGLDLLGAFLVKLNQNSGDPLIGFAKGLITGEDPFSGTRIYRPGSDVDDAKKAVDIGNYAMRTLAPPLMPSLTDIYNLLGGEVPDELRLDAGRQIETIIRAQEGKRDYKNRLLTPVEAGMQMLGFKAQRVSQPIVVAQFNRDLMNDFDTARRENVPEDVDKEDITFSEDKLVELEQIRPQTAEKIRKAQRDAAVKLSRRVEQHIEFLAPFADGPLEGQQILQDAMNEFSQYQIHIANAKDMTRAAQDRKMSAGFAVSYLKEAIKRLNEFNKFDAEVRALSKPTEMPVDASEPN